MPRVRKLRIVEADGEGAYDGRGDRALPERCETDDVGFRVAFVAANPEAGDIMPDTGGVRKIRWALAGQGKRGGARVIYYFHSDRLPVFLLAAYGKNEKSNLTMAERHIMKKLIPILVGSYLARGKHEYET